MTDKSLIWTGPEYHSLENCDINATDTGTEIKSVVIGNYERQSFKVEYFIKVNPNWETLFFDLKCQLGQWKQQLAFESDGAGKWYFENNLQTEFNGCVDIDIPVTPFTNTLPIRRLQLKTGDCSTIKVLYLDILNHSIRPVEQRYTRISEYEYKYEDVPPGFDATVQVDDDGLVVEYPPLFMRKQLRDPVKIND